MEDINTRNIEIKEISNPKGNPLCFDGYDGNTLLFTIKEKNENWNIDGVFFLKKDGKYLLQLKKGSDIPGDIAQFLRKTFSFSKVNKEIVIEKYLDTTKRWLENG